MPTPRSLWLNDSNRSPYARLYVLDFCFLVHEVAWKGVRLFNLYKAFLSFPSDMLLTLIGLDAVQVQNRNCVFRLSLRANRRQNTCFGGLSRCENVFVFVSCVCGVGAPVSVEAVWPVAEVSNLTLKSPPLLGISSLTQAFHTRERSVWFRLAGEVIAQGILGVH